jgi:hypothetical protein
MRCKYCDCENRPGRNICEFCGAPLEYVEEVGKKTDDVESPPEKTWHYFPEEAPPDVPDYLLPAVLITVLCCMPIGIIAIMFAAQAKTLASRGEYDRAMQAAERAKLFCWVAFGTAAVLLFCFILAPFCQV